VRLEQTGPAIMKRAFQPKRSARILLNLMDMKRDRCAVRKGGASVNYSPEFTSSSGL